MTRQTTAKMSFGTAALAVVLGVGTLGWAQGGTIQGTVTTSKSSITKPLEVPDTKSEDGGPGFRDICGNSVKNETLLVNGDKLLNAIVSVKGAMFEGDLPKMKTTLDQKGCRYIPHANAVTKMSTVTVMNSDNLLHNVHAKLIRDSGSKTVFNLAMPKKGQKIDRKLKKSGEIKVGCDAGHTWMSAHIHVFPHPWFAVTGENGAFQIKDVPPGTHELVVWHETLGKKTQTVTVKAGEITKAEFAF